VALESYEIKKDIGCKCLQIICIDDGANHL
jgi:hypothetical protein